MIRIFWTTGRVFSWRYISEDFDANFPGPVVEFFLDEIFLGIVYSNFPGPVVISHQKCSVFFLQLMRCGRGVVVLWCGRGGPVVEFFLEELFLYRGFLFEFSWTSGRFFLKKYV